MSALGDFLRDVADHLNAQALRAELEKVEAEIDYILTTLGPKGKGETDAQE